MAKELHRYHNKDHVEVGIDEVGRGSLAGPVVAAAVVWNPEEEDELWRCIRDSKKLSAARRCVLSDYIKDVAVDYSIVEVPPAEIDRINILQATIQAMHEALDRLYPRFDEVLVDGDRFRAYMPQWSSGFVPHQCIVEGDNTYVSIAAASILAKVHRDGLMVSLAPEVHPDYGWTDNKGYGTAAHVAAIQAHGLTPHHRRTFVRNIHCSQCSSASAH
jgi:ribonuclease HII